MSAPELSKPRAYTWFTVHGHVGLRSPTCRTCNGPRSCGPGSSSCRHCGAPNPRPLSEAEQREYEAWRER